MAAPHSVDPEGMLEQHLVSTSPDLLREMIASFANAMMSAQAKNYTTASPHPVQHTVTYFLHWSSWRRTCQVRASTSHYHRRGHELSLQYYNASPPVRPCATTSRDRVDVSWP
jgi:hypothetical protein